MKKMKKIKKMKKRGRPRQQGCTNNIKFILEADSLRAHSWQQNRRDEDSNRRSSGVCSFTDPIQQGCPEGIKINGETINNIRYADNTVTLASSLEDLQTLLEKENQCNKREIWT